MAAAATKKAPARAETKPVPMPPPVQARAVPIEPPAVPRPQVQPPPGRAVAIGRDGQPIWRHSAPIGSDGFAIDPSLMPDGWIYEWKRYSVYGQPDHAYHAQLKRVGRWESVPAERHDGVFLPPGTKGSIIIDGLILMERPRALHAEALREEKQAADAVVQKAKAERSVAVPGGAMGVSTSTDAARQASFVNTQRVFSSEDDKAALASVPIPAYDRSID